ncbi:MAG: methanesulfonate monooxygenase [Betaproteobacteria bacterium]|nr:MAG: methanesulfonate monooxygenase [Betaproteobacteria bacterium]
MPLTDNQIGALIYRSGLFMDEENFDGFMQLCASDFRYQITAYSPELGKEMIWLNLDREGMEHLLKNIPNHVRLPGSFLRNLNVYLMEPQQANGDVHVTSSLLVIHTDLEGASRLYAAGMYIDDVVLSSGSPQLKSRTVKLATRQLGPGSHVPL